MTENREHFWEFRLFLCKSRMYCTRLYFVLCEVNTKLTMLYQVLHKRFQRNSDTIVRTCKWRKTWRWLSEIKSEPREVKGDREGIPHTHPIPLVIRLELFLRPQIQREVSWLDNSQSHSVNVFRVDNPRSQPRVPHDIAIRFVYENDYGEISAKAVSAKRKLKKNRPSSLV